MSSGPRPDKRAVVALNLCWWSFFTGGRAVKPLVTRIHSLVLRGSEEKKMTDWESTSRYSK